MARHLPAAGWAPAEAMEEAPDSGYWFAECPQDVANDESHAVARPHGFGPTNEP